MRARFWFFITSACVLRKDLVLFKKSINLYCKPFADYVCLIFKIIKRLNPEFIRLKVFIKYNFLQDITSWATCKKNNRTLIEAKTEAKNLESYITAILSGLCGNTHSTKNDKMTISPAMHILKFLRQPAFGTFVKPHISTHNQSFAKEPNFAHTLNRIITFKEYKHER